MVWRKSSDFLKERLFGLSNPQGNHGESLKEAHFHLDNTPTVRLTLPCLRQETDLDTSIAFLHEILVQIPSMQIPLQEAGGRKCEAG